MLKPKGDAGPAFILFRQIWHGYATSIFDRGIRMRRSLLSVMGRWPVGAWALRLRPRSRDASSSPAPPTRWSSRNAVDESLESLCEAIDKWKAESGVTGPVSEIAEKPRPHPYWRSEISPHLFLPPDTVTDSAYSICWKGVVSPVVCTSGAKLCW
jgi:hypothetical protein